MQERRKLAKLPDIDLTNYNDTDPYYDDFWYPFFCYVGIICCALLLYMRYNDQTDAIHEFHINQHSRLLRQNIELADEIVKLRNPLKPIAKKVRKK